MLSWVVYMQCLNIRGKLQRGLGGLKGLKGLEVDYIVLLKGIEGNIQGILCFVYRNFVLSFSHIPEGDKVRSPIKR